jgi:hypothetical protein
MKLPDPVKALELYYTQTEINSAEIKKLFLVMVQRQQG